MKFTFFRTLQLTTCILSQWSTVRAIQQSQSFITYGFQMLDGHVCANITRLNISATKQAPVFQVSKRQYCMAAETNINNHLLILSNLSMFCCIYLICQSYWKQLCPAAKSNKSLVLVFDYF